MTTPVTVAGTVTVAEVGPEAAAVVLGIVRAGFGGRPELDPPSTALEETETSLADALGAGGGLVASVDGRPAGALLMSPEPGSLLLRRVAVRPDAQHHGVARALSATVDDVAARRGFARVHLTARAELPGTVRFWQRLGYREVGRDGPVLDLAKELPVTLPAPTAEHTRRLGGRVAGLLRAGDVLVLTGDLGAGKTTFTQGLGAGLGVRGDVTSPTFVISRIHPSLVGGPALVHVDAYRLGPGTGSDSASVELDDLDLDVSVEESVTVVEWGAGLADSLAEDRLEVILTRTRGETEDSEERTVTLVPLGARWVGSDLGRALA